jgi:hypothetical protein
MRLCWQIYRLPASRMSTETPRRQETSVFASPPPTVEGAENAAKHTMKSAKQIIFRYNDDPTTDEIDLDMDGDKSIPEQGVRIERKGQRWKVQPVNVETNTTEPFEVPVHRVFLISEF